MVSSITVSYGRLIEKFSNHISGMRSLMPYEWNVMKKQAERCMMTDGAEFHKAMQPYYEMYITADHRLFRDGVEGFEMSNFVECVFNCDDRFAKWMANKDIIEVTEKWIESKGLREYLKILQRLVDSDYKTDWGALEDKVADRLGLLDVYGDNVSNEYFCILYGFVSIMSAPLPYEERLTLFGRFRDNWNFMKHMYSVMLGRMVGLGLQNFVQVANNVKTSPNYHPHLHLIYAAMKERIGELCPNLDSYEKMSSQLKDIENKIKCTPQETTIELLCEILFPDNFRPMLDKHRYKPYNELQETVKRLEESLKDQDEKIKVQVRIAADEIKKAFEESSVSIDDIEKQLLGINPETAFNIYYELNTLLAGNRAWSNNTERIRIKILEKREQHEAKMPMPISDEKEKEIVDQLMPIFCNLEENVWNFMRKIRNAKSSAITAEVNELVEKGVVNKQSCHKDLWTVLHNNKLYKPSLSNWNQQIK